MYARKSSPLLRNTMKNCYATNMSTNKIYFSRNDVQTHSPPSHFQQGYRTNLDSVSLNALPLNFVVILQTENVI